VLGVVLGYSGIPENWKGGIPALADKKFAYTGYSFHSIVASTEKRALELIRRTGGRVEGSRVLVNEQRPKPARLEVWDDYGSPVERVAASDPRWKFKGDWNTEGKQPGRITDQKGAEAEIAFEGTGAIVVGPYLVKGGMLDVYLDGKLDRTLDVYSDEKGDRGGESVWHSFGLKSGKHVVRLVARGESYRASGGAYIAIQSLIYFR